MSISPLSHPIYGEVLNHMVNKVVGRKEIEGVIMLGSPQQQIVA
jgi:hypothetical protein